MSVITSSAKWRDDDEVNSLGRLDLLFVLRQGRPTRRLRLMGPTKCQITVSPKLERTYDGISRRLTIKTVAELNKKGPRNKSIIFVH